MKLWQAHKERCVAEGMGLRQQSIFLQLFADIADYAEKNPAGNWTMMDVRDMLSQRSFWLR